MKHIKPHYFLLWLTGMLFAASLLTLMANNSDADTKWITAMYALPFFPILLMDAGIYYAIRSYRKRSFLTALHLISLALSIIGLWFIPLFSTGGFDCFLLWEYILFGIGHSALFINLITAWMRRKNADRDHSAH